MNIHEDGTTSLLGENDGMKSDGASGYQENSLDNNIQLENKDSEGEGQEQEQKQENCKISKESIDQCGNVEGGASTLVTKSPPVIMHIRTESIDETVV